MKTKLTLFTLLIFLFFAGCKDGNITFYVNDSVETTLKTGSPINLPFNIPIGNVSSSKSTEFKNNNTTPDLIKTVVLEELTATITNPADEDFSFIKSIHIFIMKSDDTEKKEIAYLDDISSTAQKISLICTDENLVPYLQDSTYKLDTQYTIKEYPGHDIDLRLDLKFKVGASVLK